MIHILYMHHTVTLYTYTVHLKLACALTFALDLTFAFAYGLLSCHHAIGRCHGTCRLFCIVCLPLAYCLSLFGRRPPSPIPFLHPAQNVVVLHDKTLFIFVVALFCCIVQLLYNFVCFFIYVAHKFIFVFMSICFVSFSVSGFPFLRRDIICSLPFFRPHYNTY